MSGGLALRFFAFVGKLLGEFRISESELAAVQVNVTA